jgi:hypothetical protein
LKAEMLDLLLTPKKLNCFEPPLAYNGSSLGDVAKKHTELLRLLQVRKAQNKL